MPRQSCLFTIRVYKLWLRCAGIVDPAMDALIELLRLQTLGRGGLHQVQLDVHAIRQMLRRYAFVG